jgi:hypothetical protein
VAAPPAPTAKWTTQLGLKPQFPQVGPSPETSYTQLCVSRPRSPERLFLLDYDDRYGIREVGFYLARQGALIRWTVPEFLTMLGARIPLPQLRVALRAHLRGSRPA